MNTDGKRTILIVEDDDGLADLMRRHVERQGHRPVVFGSGREALAWLADQAPDLLILDFSPADMTGHELLDQLPPERRSLPFVITTGRGGEEVAVPYMQRGALDCIVKDDQFWALLAASLARALGRIETETRLQQAETDLAHQHRLNGLLLDSLPCVAVLVDADARIVAANRVARERGGEMGQPAAALFSGDAIRHVRTALADDSLSTHSVELEDRGQWFELHCAPLPDDRRILYACDITDRKAAEAERRHLEEQFHQTQKVKTVGQLAGGIAHDFNNLLAAILGYGELLERRLEEGSKERHYAAMILESTAQAEALTKQLLGFARRRSEDGPPAQVHIHRAVETAADLLRPSCRRIGIRLELQAEPCTTLGDRNQLESALVNLGLNARDAMPDGGTLIFRTRLLAPDGSEHETLPADHCEGAYLRLEIVDTGCGMDDETSRHAFEPFYSTKPRGEGTGLGLVSVYGAMQAHRGTVDIHSAPGKGTTVKLLFPLVAAAPDAAPAAFRPGRILLADDEDLVRELTATRLRDLGHTVEAFPDGESLLAAFAHRRGETDLVLLDVLMPGMDGLEVFHRVREIDPEARVLFVTGYADQARLGAALEDGAFDIIHKPFDSEELCVTVARALGDRHAPFASDSPARA